MEISQIITLVTMLVAILLGFVSKKLPWFNNYLIPVQNLLIGVIVAFVEWTITKNFNYSIAAAGLLAGGAYDVFNNFNKLTDLMKSKLENNNSQDKEN